MELPKSDPIWETTFSKIGAQVRKEILPILGTDEAAAEVGVVGAGGDRTLEIDRRAEEIVIGHLDGLAAGGARFSVLSEECGRIDHGADFPLVLVDPVDGSTNARRGGLSGVAVMLSLVRGPRIADVELGYTLNLLTGKAWLARRGVGLFSNNQQVKPMRRCDKKYELLCLHARKREELKRGGEIITNAMDIRQLGSLALSLIYTAEGGMDLFCSPREVRVFDMTAGILAVREVGGIVTDINGDPVDLLPLDLTTRTTILSSAHPDIHAGALELLSGVRSPI